jgi:hypothetical protein
LDLFFFFFFFFFADIGGVQIGNVLEEVTWLDQFSIRLCD